MSTHTEQVAQLRAIRMAYHKLNDENRAVIDRCMANLMHRCHWMGETGAIELLAKIGMMLVQGVR